MGPNLRETIYDFVKGREREIHGLIDNIKVMATFGDVGNYLVPYGIRGKKLRLQDDKGSFLS